VSGRGKIVGCKEGAGLCYCRKREDCVRKREDCVRKREDSVSKREDLAS
jgi:hypothetical protein